MSKPNFYHSGDYAGLSCKAASFYYGYEQTEGEGENEEWCFTADVVGLDQQIRIPFSKLGASDQCECVDCLMIGIGWVLTKYKIEVE